MEFEKQCIATHNYINILLIGKLNKSIQFDAIVQLVDLNTVAFLGSVLECYLNVPNNIIMHLSHYFYTRNTLSFQ